MNDLNEHNAGEEKEYDVTAGAGTITPPPNCELCGAPLNDLDTRSKLWPKGDYNHKADCPTQKSLL